MTASSLVPILSFLCGMGLSALHFGGLWLTVRSLPGCVRPRLLFWSSYFLRYGITLAGFSQVMKQGGLALASALLGFYLMRSFALSRHCSNGLAQGAGLKVK